MLWVCENEVGQRKDMNSGYMHRHSQELSMASISFENICTCTSWMHVKLILE